MKHVFVGRGRGVVLVFDGHERDGVVRVSVADFTVDGYFPQHDGNGDEITVGPIGAGVR